MPKSTTTGLAIRSMLTLLHRPWLPWLADNPVVAWRSIIHDADDDDSCLTRLRLPLLAVCRPLLCPALLSTGDSLPPRIMSR